jgi:hypothetical protein
MKTHNLKLHVLAAVLASASVFHVGCGDDDDNARPSNTGGKSGTGGSSTGTGGKSGTGGSSTATGGEPTGTGGIDGTSGAGNNTSAGSGGEPTVGGAGGTPGTDGGTPGTDGGAAGSGGAGPQLPACDDSHFDSTNECYLDCEPNTTASSEEFLNHCSDAGANCTPFDNTTLDKLVNGALPPLP